MTNSKKKELIALAEKILFDLAQDIVKLEIETEQKIWMLGLLLCVWVFLEFMKGRH